MRKKATPLVLGLLLTVLYALWLAWPITIITADIGRHLTDGRVFFEFPQWRNALLSTNFYSVSNADFAIVNHHWAAGLIFYAVHSALGWEGLHVFAMLLCIGALALFVHTAAKVSKPAVALSIAVLLLPMIAYRLEVRPEFFGYLFMGLTLSVLHAISVRQLPVKSVYALPIVTLLWVNLHASFPLGIGLLGLYVADAFVQKRPEKKPLLMALFLSGLATLLNPSGLAGALYPLAILQDPGYAVTENQSLAFLSGVGVQATAFTYLKVVTALYLGALALLVKKKAWQPQWPLLTMAGLVLLMSWLAVRHITMAGFLLIPVFALAVHKSQFSKSSAGKSIAVALIIVSVLWQGHTLSNRWLVLGLERGANAAAEFVREQGIEGPLFNNFDIGGYVIHHFFPDIKPYAYNRPESHPADFWRNTYVPAMQDNAKWNELLAKEQFNMIMLFHGDHTTWAQKFLVNRIQDPQWTAVFVDRSVIVLVRQNGKNAELISRYAIPASQLLE